VKVAAIHLGNTEHDGPTAEDAYWAMVADGMVYDEVQAEWDELRARGIGWGRISGVSATVELHFSDRAELASWYVLAPARACTEGEATDRYRKLRAMLYADER
jgi:hypothetical protein